ncbi:MAG: hypothetical protein QY325_01945 [Flavobacteriales bacterium]|nr:MAG: hypothetical protein QY325_01945 [Flavobacteriales bacterium]
MVARALLVLALLLPAALRAQPDTIPATDEEDYSQYDDLGFADEKARRYAHPKVLDLSPQRFISVLWDAQGAYTMQSSPLGSWPEGADAPLAEEAHATYTGGLRVQASIPVVSRNSIVWQMQANYWDVRYNVSPSFSTEASAGLLRTLGDRGLRTTGLGTTLFKPLSETGFVIVQASADLSGDYFLDDPQSLEYLRGSIAALWGRRPHDRLQWAVGLSRTYRVGAMNYIPVVMYNYTAANRKWGTEILFPARAHYRRTFSPRSLLLTGYELEGQSYRIQGLSTDANSFEVRRGELRLRAEYQRQLKGFVWLSLQAGYRHDWSFNADALPGGNEFFRGLFGDQPFAMLNSLGGAPYAQVGVHLVSP